jgi:hypothetical protein
MAPVGNRRCVFDQCSVAISNFVSKTDFYKRAYYIALSIPERVFRYSPS